MDESRNPMNAAQTNALLSVLQSRCECISRMWLGQKSHWLCSNTPRLCGRWRKWRPAAANRVCWLTHLTKVCRGLQMHHLKVPKRYDEAALMARTKHPPQGSAMAQAAAMGVSLINAEQYQVLQRIWPCDLKTSSWLATPDAIRRLGGALFGDRRYDKVFVYHNGADSYYAARGFRCVLSLSLH